MKKIISVFVLFAVTICGVFIVPTVSFAYSPSPWDNHPWGPPKEEIVETSFSRHDRGGYSERQGGYNPQYYGGREHDTSTFGNLITSVGTLVLLGLISRSSRNW